VQVPLLSIQSEGSMHIHNRGTKELSCILCLSEVTQGGAERVVLTLESQSSCKIGVHPLKQCTECTECIECTEYGDLSQRA
jgi:hypothetical protein